MNNRSLAPEIEYFSSELESLIEVEQLYSHLGKTKDSFEIEDLILEIDAHYVDVDDFIRSMTIQLIEDELTTAGQLKGANNRRIVVAPCSPLFNSAFEFLSLNYQNLIFIDQNFSGGMMYGHSILSSDEVDVQNDDLCLILTRNTSAIKFYKNKFTQDNTIDFMSLYQRDRLSNQSESLTKFINKLNLDKKVVLFSSPRPLGTLASTMRGLKDAGYHNFWLGSEDVKHERQIGYSTPKVTQLDIDDYYIGSGLLEIIRTFSLLENGMVFFHHEAIFPPNWDFSRIAICYAATIAIIRTVKKFRPESAKGKFALYLYDAIKPGVLNYHAGKACGSLY